MPHNFAVIERVFALLPFPSTSSFCYGFLIKRALFALAAMSSLITLPELVGFFSYSRDDDRDSRGALSALRDRIQGDLRGLLGRSPKTLRLFQDNTMIPPGSLWENRIKDAVARSSFFIIIITPTVIASECSVRT